jgi:putative transcriptional regulator
MSAITKRKEGEYRYTESGLENVYLVNGFTFVEGPHGLEVQIDDIDGLHRAIGEVLINCHKNLSGKDIRFLRTEMLMSQSMLARLLGVSDRAVIRWEQAPAGQVPSTAEASIRMLYRDFINEDGKSGTMRRMLKRIADMEDESYRVALSKVGKAKWRPAVSVEDRQLDLAVL